MTLRRRALVSIGAAFVLGGAACSSSSSSGTGGAAGGVVPTGGMTGALGGTTGTGAAPGGTSGTAGNSGAGGGAAIACGNLPPCVATLVAACPLASNACLIADSSAGNTVTQNICFGNPATVKAVNAVTIDPNTGAGSTAIAVTKNGVPCYTLDGTFNFLDPATTPRLLSFKNASGIELATFSTDVSTFPNPTTVTCAGEQPVLVTDFGNCGMPNHPEPDFCVGGVCVAP